MDELRTERITFLVTPTEKAVIEKLAQGMKRTLSDAIRLVVLEHSENQPENGNNKTKSEG
jgi:hypothetical protein